jgi:hypothetical protein
MNPKLSLSSIGKKNPLYVDFYVQCAVRDGICSSVADPDYF